MEDQEYLGLTRNGVENALTLISCIEEMSAHTDLESPVSLQIACMLFKAQADRFLREAEETDEMDIEDHLVLLGFISKQKDMLIECMAAIQAARIIKARGDE